MANAGGDICFELNSRNGKIPLDRIHCLKTEGGEPSTPFWKNSRELGYLFKDIWTPSSQNNKIVVENLNTSSKHVLVEGKIWSPAMRFGGRYLFYNQWLEPSGASLGKKPESACFEGPPDRTVSGGSV